MKTAWWILRFGMHAHDIDAFWISNIYLPRLYTNNGDTASIVNVVTFYQSNHHIYTRTKGCIVQFIVHTKTTPLQVQILRKCKAIWNTGNDFIFEGVLQSLYRCRRKFKEAMNWLVHRAKRKAYTGLQARVEPLKLSSNFLYSSRGLRALY